MNWVKANYDRVALIAATLILFLCALSIWRNVSHFSDNFAAAQTTFRPKDASPPPTAVELEKAAGKLKEAPQWKFTGPSGLFVPAKHFIGPNGLPATLESTEVHPPVPNEWLEQYGLAISDADILEQDPDGDGFTNLAEWKGHTNPTDKNSRPEYFAALRLKSLREEPFRLLFSSWNPVTKTAQIETIDFSEPTQFLRVGSQIGGTQFKILKFIEKHQKNPATGGDEDVSELAVENMDSHDQLTLAMQRVATSPEPVATFVYTWPAGQPSREFQVRKDQEFSLKPMEQTKYKLVETEAKKVAIINVQKPNDRIEIGVEQ